MFGNKCKRQLDIMTVVAMSFALQKEGTPEGLSWHIACESYERSISNEDLNEFHKVYMTIEEYAKRLSRTKAVPSIGGN